MYKSFYNLHCKPFENTPDPDFLFLSSQHREALSSLLYGIEESKGFILISGSVGTGKTTIVRSFLKKTTSEHIIINIINPKTSFNDVLELLAKKLFLDSAITNQIELIEAMRERLIGINKSGQRVIIVIDEAHLLQETALEEIRLLSNIEHEKEKLLQIVLVGQNEIYDLLEKENQKSLKQRIVINRQLIPLNAPETNGYIGHRLHMAGNDQQLFTKDALRKIWKKSHGTPRLINHICDNALLIGYATESSQITKKIITEVIQDMGKKADFTNIVPKTSIQSKAYLAIAASCLLTLGIFWNGRAQTAPTHKNLSLAQSSMITSLRLGRTSEDAISPKYVITVPRETQKTLQKQRNNQELSALADNTESPAPLNLITKKIITSKKSVQKKLPYSKSQPIRPGDNLFDIAYRNYGTMSETIIDYIQQANGIQDINTIYFGQTIRLPQLTLSDLIKKKGNNRLHIHFASLYSERAAISVGKNLEKAGEDVSIEESMNGKNKIYRVYVGDFPDRDTANSKLETLDLKYLHFLNNTKSLAFNK